MIVTQQKQEVREFALQCHQEGKQVAVCFSGGGLHPGHQKLIETAKQEDRKVIFALFRPPPDVSSQEARHLTFGQSENDARKASEWGADLFFDPLPEDFYGPTFSTSVEENLVGRDLCGLSRPHAFRGIATFITKFLLLTSADVLMGGEKDAQQAAVLHQIIKDLEIPCRQILIPTVRMDSGTAYDSKLEFLNEFQKEEMSSLYQSLKEGLRLVHDQAIRSPDRIKAEVIHHLSRRRRLRVIYVSVVDKHTIQPARTITPGSTLLAAAVWVDEIRFIDNILLQ